MSARRFNDLLLNLYACPGERARWPLVLDRICEATHARSAVVQRLVTGRERAWARWMVRDSESEAAAAEHDRYMGDAVNPRMRVTCQPPHAPMKYFVRDRDLFAPTDPAYADLRARLAALHLGSFMGACVTLPGGERLVLSLHRDVRNSREFAAPEESFARRLIPHLQQAVMLSAKYEAAQTHGDDLGQALNQLQIGCIVSGRDLHVHWANDFARRTFALRDGLWIRQERLACASAQDAERLHAAVAHTDEGCLAIGSAITGESLHLIVHPISQGRALILFSASSAVAHLAPDRIGRLFGLSPAESRVAAALCSGLSVAEYAEAHGVTSGTARFQLKQVLAKTGAERQSDLIRKLCSSVVGMTLAEGGV